MPTGKVNKRTIDALRPGPSAAFLWDEDLKGFGVKITPAGALSYVLQYRMGGREAKTQRFTIGGHGSPWTPTTARTEAERLSVLIAQGIDPAEAEKKRRREAVDLAFSAYADSFLKSCKGDGWRALVERSLRIHVKPVLAKKALPLGSELCPRRLRGAAALPGNRQGTAQAGNGTPVRGASDREGFLVA